MGRLRISLARFMIRMGQRIQSLSLVVMCPGDLVEFSRQSYARPTQVANWSEVGLVDGGLRSDELGLLEQSPVESGRLLLLQVGGGREVIPLAQRGFQVTGVDFIPGMVEQAKAHAARHGVHLEGLVQEISRLDVAPASFDLAWLSARMYSCVPTRLWRVEMLRRIRQALRPGGCFICQFAWNPKLQISPRGWWLRRVLACLSWGYRQFEPGDMLWGDTEFLHVFGNKNALRAEFVEGGFEVLHLEISDSMGRGSAVLQKKGEGPTGPVDHPSLEAGGLTQPT
jgi:SAM-dependent methyltransferase